MKYKRLFFVGGIFVGIIVIIFLVLFFKGIMDDTKVTNHQMLEVKRLNSNFDSYIDEYNATRNALIFLLGETYTDHLDLKYDNIVMLLDKEQDYVKDVSDVISQLDGYCRGKVYSDQSVNQICVNYPVNYEELVNVFLGDIEHVNTMVSNYLEKHSGNISFYQTDLFKDYIDYDGDGVYSGKEE